MRTLRVLFLLGALQALEPGAGAQNLNGTVVAGDTGAALGGVTVVAIQVNIAHSRPAVVKAVAGSNGQYSLTAPAGQYRLCVHGSGLYLNPCQWGGSAIVSAPATGATTTALRLQKGTWFMVRVHDPQNLLPGRETVATAGVSASVSGAGVEQLPLPVVYDNGHIRDYGAVVPAGVPMRAVVSGVGVVLADDSGAAPSAQGIAFTAPLPTASVAPSGPKLTAFLPPRVTATIIHIHVTGAK